MNIIEQNSELEKKAAGQLFDPTRREIIGSVLTVLIIVSTLVPIVHSLVNFASRSLGMKVSDSKLQTAKDLFWKQNSKISPRKCAREKFFKPNNLQDIQLFVDDPDSRLKEGVTDKDNAKFEVSRTPLPESMLQRAYPPLWCMGRIPLESNYPIPNVFEAVQADLTYKEASVPAVNEKNLSGSENSPFHQHYQSYQNTPDFPYGTEITDISSIQKTETFSGWPKDADDISPCQIRLDAAFEQVADNIESGSLQLEMYPSYQHY
jgi:hypothetical protein